MFQFSAGGFYEMSIWPMNKAFVISLLWFPFTDFPLKAISGGKTKGHYRKHRPSGHFLILSFFTWWCGLTCQSACTWMSLACCLCWCFELPYKLLSLSFRHASSTGRKTKLHIDLRRAKSMSVFVRPQAQNLGNTLKFSSKIPNSTVRIFMFWWTEPLCCCEIYLMRLRPKRGKVDGKNDC